MEIPFESTGQGVSLNRLGTHLTRRKANSIPFFVFCSFVSFAAFHEFHPMFKRLEILRKDRHITHDCNRNINARSGRPWRLSRPISFRVEALAKTMGLGYDPSVQDNLGRAAANLFDQFVDAARARGGVPGGV